MLNVTGTAARQQALVDSIRLSMRFERSFIQRAVPILDRQARAAANVYKETEDLPATLIAVDAFTQSWEDRYEKHYLLVGEKIGKRFYDDLKSERRYVETKDFESFFLDFMRFVGFKGAEKVQLIQDTTKRIIKTAISLARTSARARMPLPIASMARSAGMEESPPRSGAG
jgi:hypothetical protein